MQRVQRGRCTGFSKPSREFPSTDIALPRWAFSDIDLEPRGWMDTTRTASLLLFTTSLRSRMSGVLVTEVVLICARAGILDMWECACAASPSSAMDSQQVSRPAVTNIPHLSSSTKFVTCLENNCRPKSLPSEIRSTMEDE